MRTIQTVILSLILTLISTPNLFAQSDAKSKQGIEEIFNRLNDESTLENELQKARLKIERLQVELDSLMLSFIYFAKITSDREDLEAWEINTLDFYRLDNRLIRVTGLAGETTIGLAFIAAMQAVGNKKNNVKWLTRVVNKFSALLLGLNVAVEGGTIALGSEESYAGYLYTTEMRKREALVKNLSSMSKAELLEWQNEQLDKFDELEVKIILQSSAIEQLQFEISSKHK
ncbi:MAG: hypothetical protein AB8E15_08885 [Bdellovibrionales bacterium]